MRRLNAQGTVRNYQQMQRGRKDITSITTRLQWLAVSAKTWVCVEVRIRSGSKTWFLSICLGTFLNLQAVWQMMSIVNPIENLGFLSLFLLRYILKPLVLKMIATRKVTSQEPTFRHYCLVSSSRVIQSCWMTPFMLSLFSVCSHWYPFPAICLVFCFQITKLQLYLPFLDSTLLETEIKTASCNIACFQEF